jgi:hypothetical protein
VGSGAGSGGQRPEKVRTGSGGHKAHLQTWSRTVGEDLSKGMKSAVPAGDDEALLGVSPTLHQHPRVFHRFGAHALDLGRSEAAALQEALDIRSPAPCAAVVKQADAHHRPRCPDARDMAPNNAFGEGEMR